MARLRKGILYVFAVIVVLMLGMLIGAWVGGNYAINFQFNGVRGYEATAQVGVICSVTLLTIWGLFLYRRKK